MKPANDFEKVPESGKAFSFPCFLLFLHLFYSLPPRSFFLFSITLGTLLLSLTLPPSLPDLFRLTCLMYTIHLNNVVTSSQINSGYPFPPGDG